MEKKKSKLKIIIYSLLPLLALLIAAELLLRVVYFQRNNKDSFALVALIHKMQNRNAVIETENRFIRLKELRPSLDYKIRPQKEYLQNCENLIDKEYKFRTDSNGFILPQFNDMNSSFSIFFLGGSTTECSFVSEDLRYPYLVGKHLNDTFENKINVYNSGVSGNHTYHAIDILLNKIVPLKPKYVVLMECINDWTTLLFEGSYWNRNPTRSLIVDPNSKLPINSDEWAHLRGKKLAWDAGKIVEEFKKAQLTFISICKANNIEPILMTQANRYSQVPDEKITKDLTSKLEPFGLTYDDVKNINSLMNNQIRENATKNNLLLIDLDRLVPRSSVYMYDIVHYNDKGSILAAEIISKELIKKIK